MKTAMKKRSVSYLIICACGLMFTPCLAVSAEPASTGKNPALTLTAPCAESTTNTTDRAAWWRDARFGMFIHFGLYSQLGGEYKGKLYGKAQGASAEWIMKKAKIPIEEYEQIAKDFNPTNFNAKEWVSAAKGAGMKYMVFTAKHIEGFSMYATKVTPYNIVDATPFKRDIVKELADECKAQGIKFCVYYSHTIDWHNHTPLVDPKDKNQLPPKYVDFVKAQLTELLTNYGDLGLVWFDAGDKNKDVNTEYGNLVRKLQPNCLVSGRLNGNGNISDYHNEGDRRIPRKNVEGDAETPMTLYDNWGYCKVDNHWKTDKDMMERFVLTVCRGANMLLNISPHPDGTFDPHELHFLNVVGEWLKVNGESIYGTQSSPFDFDFPWGSMTRKGNRLYLHVLVWDPAGIAFNGLKSKPTKAYLLADTGKKQLDIEQKGDSTKILVPGQAPDPNDSVIVLEFNDTIQTNPQAAGKYIWQKTPGVTADDE